MKKGLVKLIATMIAAVFCMCTFTAFGTSKFSGSLKTNTQTKVFANKVLNVAAFQGGYGKDYWEQVVKNFEAAYPGVTVNLTVNPQIGQIIRPQVLSGNPPDFLYLNAGEVSGLINSLIKGHGLLDLTGVFNENALDKNIKLKDYMLPGFLDTSACAPYGDKKVYLAPIYYGPTGLIYNKTYFEQKKLKLPKTWDEFFALGEIAKKDNRALFTYQGIYPGYLEEILWPGIASVGGIRAMNNIYNYYSGSFNNESIKKVLTNIANISKKGYLMKGTVALNHTQSQTAMMQGKALFIPNGNWMENEMKDAPREDGFEFGAIPMPVFKSTDKQYAWTSLDTLCIPAKAKNPELAKEFLKFMYTEQSIKLNADKAKGIVPVKNGIELAKPYVTKATIGFYEMYDSGVIPLVSNFRSLPAGCKINVGQEVFDKCASKVMSNQMTVDEWADNVEKAFKQIRADMSAK